MEVYAEIVYWMSIFGILASLLIIPYLVWVIWTDRDLEEVRAKMKGGDTAAKMQEKSSGFAPMRRGSLGRPVYEKEDPNYVSIAESGDDPSVFGTVFYRLSFKPGHAGLVQKTRYVIRVMGGRVRHVDEQVIATETLEWHPVVGKFTLGHRESENDSKPTPA